MKVLAIIVAAAAALVFWCACRVGGKEDRRCGWK